VKELAYFPGCSSHSMAREYDSSARLVCERLGISLREIEDWSCCGATAAHSTDDGLALALADRNLALAEAMGMAQVTTPCAACFARLKAAARARVEATASDQAIDVQASAPPSAHPEVVHLLQLMVETVGLERIAAEVQRPLTGMRLAAYYGCLLTRPRRIARFDDPEQPTSMDRLLTALGAETVVWSHKAECCGGSFAASETEVVLDLVGQIVDAARQAGAQAIVAACPVCQVNLDTRQAAAAARGGRDHRLPVPYFVQLMGLAFGFSPKSLGLKRLLTDPSPLLRAGGIR
jgi:heterodisulfide reductase subunit B2